jgi:hypothetical protein
MPPQQKDRADEKAAARAERASKPGAVSVPASEAARLDRRIAEKQVRGGSTPPKELSQMEQDLAAKRQGKSGGGAESKPGAFSSNGEAAAELISLEDRVAAKVRREQPVVQQELNSLEDAVQAKVRGENGAGTKPGARAELNSLEDTVQAKVRGESKPGVRAELNSLEDSVQAKVRGETAGVPGVRAELNSLEDRVEAKVAGEQASKPGAHPELNSLEDRIQAKMRGESVSGKAATDTGARSELNNLEDRVQAKVRGEMPGTHEELRRREDALRSKQGYNNSAREAARLDERIAAKAATTGAPPACLQRAEEDALRKAGAGVDDTKKAGSDIKKDEDPLKTDFDDDENEPTTTADRGVIHAGPDLEYGVYSGKGGAGDEGLAVAFAVEEDDDDIFIPAAVEYDPDAKPPMYRNRRFRLYAFLAFVVLVVVAVGAAVGVTLSQDNTTETAAPIPLDPREQVGIRENVERVIGSDKLDDQSSPYAKALNWITFTDPMQLTPDAPNFMQRYLAAYLYYATTEKRPWYSCNPPNETAGEDSNCLFQKLVGIDPPEYAPIPWNRWLSEAHECQWAGVFCDQQEMYRGIELRKYWSACLSEFLSTFCSNLLFHLLV